MKLSHYSKKKKQNILFVSCDANRYSQKFENEIDLENPMYSFDRIKIIHICFSAPAPQIIKVIKIQGGPPSGGQGWPTGNYYYS